MVLFSVLILLFCMVMYEVFSQQFCHTPKPIVSSFLKLQLVHLKQNSWIILNISYFFWFLLQVLYYLFRVEPFTTLSIQLQGGKFDHADRMFLDIAGTWNGVLEDMSDVKELVSSLSISIVSECMPCYC